MSGQAKRLPTWLSGPDAPLLALTKHHGADIFCGRPRRADARDLVALLRRGYLVDRVHEAFDLIGPMIDELLPDEWRRWIAAGDAVGEVTSRGAPRAAVVRFLDRWLETDARTRGEAHVDP